MTGQAILQEWGNRAKSSTQLSPSLEYATPQVGEGYQAGETIEGSSVPASATPSGFSGNRSCC